ncbi:MAG: NAD(P)H-dependent oxidoreductase [Desulfobacterales bacterium]|nr:NAD(P)H-dependent oxidoreductase [Desulfobacterales bacterium]
MAKILITYFSKSGNTRKMAEAIRDGAVAVEGVEVILKKVQETTPDDMLSADGILMGSPTYFGTLAAEVKTLMDQSVRYFGKLNGKVGGAFTSSMAIGGGNETTLLSILQGLMIHGMVIQGVQKGNHYGPVSIKAPDEAAQTECNQYGRLVAELVLRLA